MEIEKPIFIIGAPRSGTTLLFSIMASHPKIWSLYRENNIIDKYFHPKKFDWQRGNELDASDVSREISSQLKESLYKSSMNYQLFFRNSCTKIYTNITFEKIKAALYRRMICQILRPKIIRLVEKKPKNCLRIPFLDAIFQDAFYVFLTRDPRTNISSLMQGWREPGKFETYKLPVGLNIKGYTGSSWNFLLPPDWCKYTSGIRLEEVCAFQYERANRAALISLERVPKNRRVRVRYEDLIAAPEKEIRKITSKVELDYTGGLKKWTVKMPAVNTSEAPNVEKWRKNEDAVTSVLGKVEDIAKRMGYNF